jgi:outer membrane protein assembly factor BamB
LVGVVLISAVAGASLTAFSWEDPYRKWTDKSGKFSVQAKFVEFTGGRVVLEREDGSKVRVSMQQLSDGDRQFVRAALAARRNESVEPKSVAAKPAARPAGVAAGDWPEWRGPRRDGVSDEKGLLDNWQETAPSLAWRSRGFGGGYSSVSIANGLIYSMGRIQGATALVAASATDGAVRWTLPIRPGGKDPNCTPTVAGGRVYGVTIEGDLVCADAQSGKQIWKVNYGQDFGGRMMSTWGYSESPLVDGDREICTPGSRRAALAALDAATGRTIWTTPMQAIGGAGKDGAGYSSVVVSNGGGVKQYVQLVGRGVIGVDAQSGAMLWGYNRVANGTANVPTPIVKGDYVFCSSGYGDGGSALLQLSKGGGGRVQAREVYYMSARQTQNHHGGMILVGDHVYMGHGHNNGFPLCIDLRSGRDVWRPGRGPGSGSAAITCADGHLYFRYENGVMALIEATPAEYRLKGTFRIASNNGRSWPHPVIAGGKLYLRDQDELLCYNVNAE